MAIVAVGGKKRNGAQQNAEGFKDKGLNTRNVYKETMDKTGLSSARPESFYHVPVMRGAHETLIGKKMKDVQADLELQRQVASVGGPERTVLGDKYGLGLAARSLDRDMRATGQGLQSLAGLGRDQQNSLIRSTSSEAQSGSAALAALRAQQASNAGDIRSLALGNRSNPAAAMRAAQGAIQQQGLQTNQQARIIQEQSRMAAERQLSEQLNAQRNLDAQQAGVFGTQFGGQQNIYGGLDQQQAQLTQQANIANTESLNDAQARLFGLAQDGKANTTEDRIRAEQANAGIASGVAKVVGAVAGAISDRREKKNIKKADADVDEMLAYLAPSSWDYKDEAHGKGRHVGVMAQDLERSKAGRSLVTEHDGKKMIDTNRAVSALLASQAQLNKRLAELEGKKRRG